MFQRLKSLTGGDDVALLGSEAVPRRPGLPPAPRGYGLELALFHAIELGKIELIPALLEHGGISARRRHPATDHLPHTALLRAVAKLGASSQDANAVGGSWGDGSAATVALQALLRDHCEIDPVLVKSALVFGDALGAGPLGRGLAALAKSGWRSSVETHRETVIHCILGACSSLEATGSKAAPLLDAQAESLVHVALDANRGDPRLLTVPDGRGRAPSDVVKRLDGYEALERIFTIMLFQRFQLLDLTAQPLYLSPTAAVFECRIARGDGIASSSAPGNLASPRHRTTKAGGQAHELWCRVAARARHHGAGGRGLLERVRRRHGRVHRRPRRLAETRAVGRPDPPRGKPPGPGPVGRADGDARL